MTSYICDLIKTNKNWQNVMESLNVKVKIQGDLAIFNYNMDVDFANPLVQESRGIIIDYTVPRVVCWPFRKFGNWQESYADEIDWSTARVQEKIDGSIIKLYMYQGAWHWATNGMIDAAEADCMYSSKNFLEVIKSASNYGKIEFDKLDRDYTYIFELVSPDTKVVIDYGYTKLFHTGTRNNITGEEYSTVDIGIEKPREYALTSFDDAIKAATELNAIGQDVEHEGFVVVDGHWNRIKIKTQEYLNVHHAINGHVMTKKRMIEYILDGGDALNIIKADVPEYKHIIMYYEFRIEEIKFEMLQAIRYAKSLYEEYSHERKAVASVMKGNPFMAMAMRNLEKEDVDIEKKYIKAEKDVKESEYYFKGHFPNEPIMPGVLIIESLAQTASVLGRILEQKDGIYVFAEIEKAKFLQVVKPNSTLILEANAITTRDPLMVVEAIAKCNERTIAKCNIKAFRKQF